MRHLIGLVLLSSLAACGAAYPQDDNAIRETSMSDTKELIVVAAPRSADPYYAGQAEEIFAFHIAYAEAVSDKDDFLVLTDKATYADYVEALGAERVAIAPQDDIWARDFSLSNTANPVMFRYTAAGQGGAKRGQSDADHVQDVLAAVMEDAGIAFGETDLLNDGGNFVDDYDGRVVISRKFLRDNQLNEANARQQIIDLLGVDHVAFIEADEQGGLEHADGVVAFISPNVLVTNSYPEDPEYARELRADLEAALPGVIIHEIVTPYDPSDIYDERFGSACGLYTNMLVTPDRIYFPQFGIPEDEQALQSIAQWTDKQIIPVRSDQVCNMGGGVRCMSWQMRGQAADAMKRWAVSTR